MATQAKPIFFNNSSQARVANAVLIVERMPRDQRGPRVTTIVSSSSVGLPIPQYQGMCLVAVVDNTWGAQFLTASASLV